MDVQGTPSPFASQAAMKPAAGNPPALGQQVPGYSGGLPAQGGLSVLANPMAKELQSYGRGEDTMLVHMTPNEVNSLQGLAMAAGGSLTINPHTGLPEAGWLGKLLPTILGAVGMAFGIPPVWMGAAGAVGGTIATGDLGKGLSMGLQAFGGAALGGAAGLGGKLGNIGGSLGLPGASAAMPSGATSAFKNAFGNMAAPSAATKTGLAGFAQNFGNAAKAGLPGGIIGKAAPMLAAQGVMSGISDAVTPSGSGYTTADGKIDNSYQGPYYSPQRKATFAPTTEELLASTKQRRYYDVGMPEVRNAQGQVVQPGSSTAPGTPIIRSVLNQNAKKGEPMYSFTQVPWMGEQPEDQTGYAEGGEVQLDHGSFVMPARETAEFAKGGTKGQEILAQIGGIPIKGPGDGVSDSIPARIGGKQEARVADGEVYFPANAVKRIGGGNEKRGTQKLYALMRKAEKSRKTAPRGGAGLDLLKDLA